MASTSISIARLRQLRVPVAWQEAVEVARLAGVAAEQHQAAITLDGCLVGTDGSVELTAAYGAGGGLTVMQLLGTLLDGQTAPPELVTLVMLGDEAPSGLTVPGQGRPKGLSLEWFVQPNPEVEVARLAVRGLAAEATQAQAASLADLRAQVAEHPPKPAAVVKKPMPPWVEYAAVGAAATLVAGGMWLVWSSWGSSVAGTVTFADVTSVIKTAASAAVERVAPANPPAAPAASTPPRAAPATSRALRSKVGVTKSAAPAALFPGSVPSSPATDGADNADATRPYVTEEVVVYPVESRVYSQEDTAVAPPALVFPKLPSQPKPDSPPTNSYMEVEVDERGEVQRVRLRSTDASLNDRMLVSAVKAWRFEPAVKDGVPVKYTLRVPVMQ